MSQPSRTIGAAPPSAPRIRLPRLDLPPHESAKLACYQRAIEATVRDGASVAIFGDPTGLISLCAAQSARRVWLVGGDGAAAAAARRQWRAWEVDNRIEIVAGDAELWLPGEGVDVAVWSRRDATLVCRNQHAACAAFQRRHHQRFGRLATTVPTAGELSVQPVEHAFCYSPERRPLAFVASPAVADDHTIGLGGAALCSTVRVDRPLPETIRWEGEVTIARGGKLNGIRFLATNVLAEAAGSEIAWPCHRLVLPIERPLAVRPGQTLRLAFEYRIGTPLEQWSQSLRVQPRTLDAGRRAA